MNFRVFVSVVVCSWALLWPMQAAYSNVALDGKRAKSVLKEPIIHQMIVKLRKPKAFELVRPLDAERSAALSRRAGVQMTGFRAMSGDTSVLRLSVPLRLSQAREAAARLAADPEVEYAEPDVPVRSYQVLPPDLAYTQRHWHYYAPTDLFIDRALLGGGNKQVTTVGGANLPSAWSRTLGSSSIVVAVIDTGVSLTHPEVQDAVLPGYDFVSADIAPLPTNFVANDGNGRDSDPTDPGDWVTAAEKAQYPVCDDGRPEDTASSWHGTHIAATIVGRWGNGVPIGSSPPPAGTSIAGIAPQVRLLPVRALGKCGGVASDVVDAIRWAAGLPVPNAPLNRTPARIINLSLGSQSGDCSTTFRNALRDVSDRALVVAAAGNEGLPSVSAPANCPGVLAVTAHTIEGINADYANVGREIALSAPGGGAPTGRNSVIESTDIGYYTWSAVLFGPREPESFNQNGQRGPAIGGFTGTSSAAAHVAAVAALVLSIEPALSPAELRAVLVENTRPHPAGTYCAQGQAGAGLCGSGLLDAAHAVAAVSAAGRGGGGALPLAQLFALALLAFAARLRRR